MPAQKKTSQPDAFERYDEAQPFLQLLADMLNRVVREQTEPEDKSTEVAEETTGLLPYPAVHRHNHVTECRFSERIKQKG
jgi:hypothetical protein